MVQMVLDLKLLEQNKELVANNLAKRGESQNLSALIELINKRKSLVGQLQIKQELRNSISKSLQKASQKEINQKRQEVKQISKDIKDAQSNLRNLEEQINTKALMIPNLLQEGVPEGEDESSNIVIKNIGNIKETTFKTIDHMAIATKAGIMDIPRAAKISGTRFAFLKNAGSRLNRALLQYMTDFHVNKGDTELTTPYLVKKEAMIATGQLPKFEDDAFAVSNDGASPYYLIPTAEVPLTNYLASEILKEEELPIRLCAYSACFRAEAGAAGKDTKGIIRLHQFEKVEMVRFATKEQAEKELEEMISRASQILSELDLPHRVVLLCAGDTGFSAEKTYDLEVWLPGQNCYKEISSCSVFGTFQARRANIRYKKSVNTNETKKPANEFVCTLNGSGLPLGRTMVAILENHQQEDGSIKIPKVLWPYMQQIKSISPLP